MSCFLLSNKRPLKEFDERVDKAAAYAWEQLSLALAVYGRLIKKSTP